MNADQAVAVVMITVGLLLSIPCGVLWAWRAYGPGDPPARINGRVAGARVVAYRAGGTLLFPEYACIVSLPGRRPRLVRISTTFTSGRHVVRRAVIEAFDPRP